MLLKLVKPQFFQSVKYFMDASFVPHIILGTGDRCHAADLLEPGCAGILMKETQTEKMEKNT